MSVIAKRTDTYDVVCDYHDSGRTIEVRAFGLLGAEVALGTLRRLPDSCYLSDEHGPEMPFTGFFEAIDQLCADSIWLESLD